MTTFSGNPHPSDDNISGTVFNLILSDGVADIELKNLSEMIEVQNIYLNVGGKQREKRVILGALHTDNLRLWCQCSFENGRNYFKILLEQTGNNPSASLAGEQKLPVTHCLSHPLAQWFSTLG